MSWPAFKWAARQELGEPHDKLVLFGLADRVSKEAGADLAWPSVAWLVEFSGLGRKVVMRCLARLQRLGMIEDSGQRRGDTRRVKVWRLALGQSSLDLPKPVKRSPRGAALRSANGADMRDHSNRVAHGTVAASNGPTRDTIPPAGPLEATKAQFPAKNKGNGPMGEMVPPVDCNGPTGDTRKQTEAVKSPPTPKAKSQIAECDSVFDAWNAMASANGLPTARQLTDDRKRKLKARLAEHGRDTIVEAIARIPTSPFLLGDNAKGWKADFDFLLIPARLNKLVEGAYSTMASHSPGQGPDVPYWKALSEGIGR